MIIERRWVEAVAESRFRIAGAVLVQRVLMMGRRQRRARCPGASPPRAVVAVVPGYVRGLGRAGCQRRSTISSRASSLPWRRTLLRAATSVPVHATGAARAADRYQQRMRTGRGVGMISMPALGRRYAMVHGTDTKALRKGPAHYPDTPLPGQGGTIGIAGHRMTYLATFRSIDELRPGERVALTMPYGRFTYSVTRTRIVRPDALWVKRRVGYEQIILTACHPLYSAAKRIVVFARLVRAQPPDALGFAAT